jgi:hypothetical protein
MKAKQITRKNNPNMMKATMALLIAGLLSTTLLGCATPGRTYDDARVAMIKKDVTTEAELLNWFGPANSRAMAPDGTKVLSWGFSPRSSHTTSSSGRLHVSLDADGKVRDYSASAGGK